EDATEKISLIEQGIIQLNQSTNKDLIYSLIQAAHFLKLRSLVIDTDSIKTISENLGKYLKSIRDDQITLDTELEDLFLSICEKLRFLVLELNQTYGIDKNHEEQIISESEIIFQTIRSKLIAIVNPLLPFAEITEIFALFDGVKSAANYYEKQVEVILQGTDTLMPKSILEHLRKILHHLINNAIAHGIESPSMRQSLGKSPGGKIIISASKENHQIMISFADDGAGIDTEKVKKKAIEKKLITEEEAKKLSEEGVYELLFHSGFSTKDERDLISGLGVGLDAIRAEVTKMGGVIKISSILGKGTVFTMYYG
ncbi:MAG TPA: ATP-binding protein, partial [Allocoleopsis sp.]